MLTLVVFVLVAVCRCEGLYSKWLRNTDLNNPYNWNKGRLPCGNDRLIIPDESPVVFYQLNTTIQEFVLPHSGEIVLGSFATIAFTNEEDHSASCLDSGAAVEFNASHPADWVDPQNWCPTDTEQGDCKQVALLDSEKIPCRTNDVVFPTGSSYYVNLGTGLPLNIRTLKVSGKAYSTTTFQTYLNSDNGKNIFPPSSSGGMSTVTINKQQCTDVTGCVCGNDQGQIFDAVCQVQNPRCTRPRCSVPLRPVGHCCDICGAQLNVTYGVGFNFNTLKEGLQRNFLDGKDAYKDVGYIVSKLSSGKVQIILTDLDGVQSSQVGNDMANDLTADINTGGFRYGINQVIFRTSSGGSSTGGTGGGPNASAQTGSAPIPRGEVAGIVIGCIVVIAIIVVVAFFIYRRKPRIPDDLGFNVFNKFTMSQKRKPQVSVPPSVGFSWSSPDNLSPTFAQSQGFDNPMYGSTPLEDIKTMNLEMTPTEYGGMVTGQQPIDTDRGFENPLYDSAHQESLFADPTSVEKPQLETVMTLGPKQEKSDTKA